MQHFRPAFAEHPMRFGRAPARAALKAVEPATDILRDIRLFAATFVAGFLFVSILIS